MTEQTEFAAQVRDALNHLHDYPYLETHPLALRLWPEDRQEGPNRAHKLHRLLLESIEALNPPTQSPRSQAQTEHYFLLAYRYVEGRELADIMQELAYSRRQFFREQRKALLRLAALLWQKLPQPAGKGDDLLAAEAEPILAQREAVQLAETVQGVLAAIGPLAEERHVALECELAPNLPPVYGSRTLVRQVLLKVLNDLITQPGAQRLRLRLQPGRRTVTVQALANPPGPLLTLDSARRLLEMMGGQWQEAEVSPAGASYRFDLPADGQKVLLAIEDNEAVVRAFGRYLASYGYQVIATASGPEALRLARELGPVVITLDIMMPDQDGWEILQSLKHDPITRDIPVLICSVLDDPDLARSLGAAAYLSKPVSQVDLLAALRNLTGSL